MVKAIKCKIQQGLEQIINEARKNPETGIGTTHDPRKEAMQACVLMAAFLGAPWQAVLAVITAGFLALRMRDWKIHPATGDPAEVATDCLVMGAAIFASQLFFLNIHSVFGVDYPSLLLRGIGLGVFGVFLVRLIFHLQTPANDPQKQPVFRLFRAVMRINVMFWVSVSFIQGTCVQAVPGSHLRDQVLGFTFAVSALILRKLVMDPGPISFKWIFIDLHSDQVVQELEGEAGKLFRPVPVKDIQFPRGTVFFALVWAISVLSTTGIAVYRLFTGAGANVNWLQLLMNLAGLSVMALIWFVIMQINKEAAQHMEDEIKQRKENERADQVARELIRSRAS